MKRTIALLNLMAAWWPSAAPVQPPPALQPTVITLRPAAEPVPALKYRLVPERIKLVPGNAATLYYRASLMSKETYSGLGAHQRLRPGAHLSPDQVDWLTIAAAASSDWLSCPIGEIPRDKARMYLELYQNALNEVELGASRSTCDWEFDRREEGMSLPLPEIQEMRQLARLMQLKARLAIVDGKPDEALHWIATAFVMGRHVSQGPILIQALVGVATDMVMTHGLEELIQVPGAPSLYWALADRPRPFIDMRQPMEGERYLLEKEVPELSELDQGAWGLDRARQFADTLQRKLFTLSSGHPILGGRGGGAMSTDLLDLSRRIGIAAMAAKIYPDAKRALIVRGRSEAQVDAMPVIQVAALYSMGEYQRIRDDTYKWMNVPYWQSYNRIDRAIFSSVNEKLANPLLSLFLMLTPALNSARLASIRLDRQLDTLQCIEAIRLYANAHEGKLPDSLEAMTDSPAPLDPATGKPFVYRVNGDSATLSAPALPGFNHPSFAIRYELKLAK